MRLLSKILVWRVGGHFKEAWGEVSVCQSCLRFLWVIERLCVPFKPLLRSAIWNEISWTLSNFLSVSSFHLLVSSFWYFFHSFPSPSSTYPHYFCAMFYCMKACRKKHPWPFAIIKRTHMGGWIVWELGVARLAWDHNPWLNFLHPRFQFQANWLFLSFSKNVSELDLI